jgi:hypothetical protein
MTKLEGVINDQMTNDCEIASSSLEIGLCHGSQISGFVLHILASVVNRLPEETK